MAEETTSLRRCRGSTRFGIEAHEAPVEDFPRQPSQKDGLGRMCRSHWQAYTAGLARAAKARKAATDGEAAGGVEATSPAEPAPARKRRRAETSLTPVAGAQGDAG